MARQKVRALAGWLLANGCQTIGPVVMLSGNSVESALLALATQYVGMICVKQAQITGAFPVLCARAAKTLDWLPWSHVFGGSHNFNMMLAHGGALYIDVGKHGNAYRDADV